MPVFQLGRKLIFPPPEMAEPDGLLAIGGDLSPPRIIEAYRQGIFPWYGEGDPILWWSPAPRLVLFPEEFHLPRRLARTIRQMTFSVTADTVFHDIMHLCARTRIEAGTETWITAEMMEAYCRMHELGFAHSIECWRGSELAGGLYGIALGRIFFGESMFSLVRDASKIALHALVQHAVLTGIQLIDCQMRTEHLVRLGARELARSDFQEMLDRFVHPLKPQKKWRLRYAGKEGTGTADACQEGGKG